MSEIKELGMKFTTCDVCGKEKECILREFTPLIYWHDLKKPPPFVTNQYVCEECLTTAKECDFCQYLVKDGGIVPIILDNFDGNSSTTEMNICHGCYFGEFSLYFYIKKKRERVKWK